MVPSWVRYRASLVVSSLLRTLRRCLWESLSLLVSSLLRTLRQCLWESLYSHKNHVETGNFPYRLCIVQVRYGWYRNGSPKISFFRYFLRYFDHSNRIPCVSMESFSKNHVETAKFPYGLCIILVRYGWYRNGSPIISFFRYFLKIFWPF